MVIFLVSAATYGTKYVNKEAPFELVIQFSLIIDEKVGINIKIVPRIRTFLLALATVGNV
jgi:hypothetical protein